MDQLILQKRLAKFITSDVFNTITDEDVLKMDSTGNWLYKGNPLTKGQIDAIKKEAKIISKMGTFDILMSEVRYHARQALDKAVTEQDIITAKMLDYFVSVMQTKIKKLADL